jgi:hypothetical protein
MPVAGLFLLEPQFPAFRNVVLPVFFVGHHCAVSFIILHDLADVLHNDKYSLPPTPDS